MNHLPKRREDTRNKERWSQLSQWLNCSKQTTVFAHVWTLPSTAQMSFSAPPPNKTTGSIQQTQQKQFFSPRKRIQMKTKFNACFVWSLAQMHVWPKETKWHIWRPVFFHVWKYILLCLKLKVRGIAMAQCIKCSHFLALQHMFEF